MRTYLKAVLTPVLLLFMPLMAPATAAPINPGFDLFSTPDGGAFIDLTPFGGGIVDLTGDPIGPGNTDTIVERTEGLGDGEEDIIEIELVALSLVSIAPVDLGGGSFFDVFVVLDPSIPSTGELEVIDHGSEGGLFNSYLEVSVIVTLVNVLNPALLFIEYATETITSTGSAWSHTPAAGYPSDPSFPSGGFFPGVSLNGEVVGVQHTGPHPETIPSVVPLPAALPLFGTGLGILGLLGWRRRRKVAV